MKRSNRSRTKDIRGRLLINGLTVDGFARKCGFNPLTVRTVINRHWGRANIKPRGDKTVAILNELKLYCETE